MQLTSLYHLDVYGLRVCLNDQACCDFAAVAAYASWPHWVTEGGILKILMELKYCNKMRLNSYLLILRFWSHFVAVDSHFSIGKFLRQKHQRQQHATVTIVLALATLGDAAQIEMILSVSCHPRWPRQVQLWLSGAVVADVFAYKLCRCKWALSPPQDKNMCWLLFFLSLKMSN